MKKWFCQVMLAGCLVFVLALECSARPLLFHATRKALAKKIRAKGFSVLKMKRSARFGKGVYLSRSPKTAMKEKKGADALLRLNVSKGLKQNSLDLTNPKPRKIRSLIKVKKMRGATKKGVIGPALGRKLGRYAGKSGKSIRYRSAKDPKGVNFFLPQKTIARHPRIIRRMQMKSGGRYK